MTPNLSPAVLAQVDVTGGASLTVLAVFILLAIAAALSLLVTYRFASGYLRTGSRPYLFLASGLFLLTAAPIFARLAFTNVVPIPGAYRSLITSGSELLGLLAILYTIYQ